MATNIYLAVLYISKIASYTDRSKFEREDPDKNLQTCKKFMQTLTCKQIGLRARKTAIYTRA
jgi:hypothetical protein